METNQETGTTQFLPGDRRVRQGVKGLVTSSNAVLLLEERHGDGEAFWTLPGGGIEPGETPRAALRRELREELQCESVLGSPLRRFPYVHASRPNVVSMYTIFECAVTEPPEPNDCEGIRGCQWLSPEELPPETLPQVRAVVRNLADLRAP